MKRITVPEDQKIIGRNIEGKPELTSMGLRQFLHDVVFIIPYWRDGSKDKLHAVVRLMKQFGEIKPGDAVDVLDRDYEFLSEAAMLKATNLAPEAALAILTLLCSITDVKDVPEEM